MDPELARSYVVTNKYSTFHHLRCSSAECGPSEASKPVAPGNPRTVVRQVIRSKCCLLKIMRDARSVNNLGDTQDQEKRGSEEVQSCRIKLPEHDSHEQNQRRESKNANSSVAFWPTLSIYDPNTGKVWRSARVCIGMHSRGPAAGVFICCGGPPVDEM